MGKTVPANRRGGFVLPNPCTPTRTQYGEVTN